MIKVYCLDTHTSRVNMPHTGIERVYAAFQMSHLRRNLLQYNVGPYVGKGNAICTHNPR